MFHQRRAELRKFAIPSASAIKGMEPRRWPQLPQLGTQERMGITRTDLPGERGNQTVWNLSAHAAQSQQLLDGTADGIAGCLCCQDTQLCHRVPVRSAGTALHRQALLLQLSGQSCQPRGQPAVSLRCPRPCSDRCFSRAGPWHGMDRHKVAVLSGDRRLLLRDLPGPGSCWCSAGQGWGTAAGLRSSPGFSGLVIPLQRPPAGECLPHPWHSRTRTKAAEESSPGSDLAHSSWPQSSTALAVGLPWALLAGQPSSLAPL